MNRTSTWSCSLARASTWSFLVTSTTLVLIPDSKNKNKDSLDYTCTAFVFITAGFILVHEIIQGIAASLINHFHSKTVVLAAIFFNIHLFLLTTQWLCRKPVKRVKCSGVVSEEECCSSPIYSNPFTAETRINRDMVLFSQS